MTGSADRHPAILGQSARIPTYGRYCRPRREAAAKPAIRCPLIVELPAGPLTNTPMRQPLTLHRSSRATGLKRLAKLGLLVALALLPITPRPVLAQEAWTEFKPDNGGFRIELPGSPKLEAVQPSPVTPNVRSYAARVIVNDHDLYMVRFDNIIKGHADVAEARFRRMRDFAVKIGSIESEEKTAVDSVPAMHFVIKSGVRVGPEIFLTLDVLLVPRDTQLLQILCPISPDRQNTSTIERIHKSLSLIGE